MVRNSVRFGLLGVAAGVATPLGLVVYGLAAGRVVDPVQLFFVVAMGAVVALGGAGWLLGRKEDELVRRNRSLQELSVQLRALSTTDALTGIPNRRALDERLDAEIGRANRYGTPLALVMIDLDLFKDLNDRFGHPTGDAMLKQVASILESERRRGDIIARYGGEEFVAVLAHADERAAVGWAERVRGRIAAAAVDVDGEPVRLTASFGVAAARAHDEVRDQLVETADHALYEAKARGRDRVVLAQQRGPFRAAKMPAKGLLR
jgi:diguanylate cyclase (GGDEF)-like protein